MCPILSQSAEMSKTQISSIFDQIAYIAQNLLNYVLRRRKWRKLTSFLCSRTELGGEASEVAPAVDDEFGVT